MDSAANWLLAWLLGFNFKMKNKKLAWCDSCNGHKKTLHGLCISCWKPINFNKRGVKPKKLLSKPSKTKSLQKHAKEILSYLGYKEYLQSDWWKLKRAQKLKSTNYKCEHCCKRATQVHHKHYKTICLEKHEDLVSLCGDCHQYQHQDIIDMNNHIRDIAKSGV